MKKILTYILFPAALLSSGCEKYLEQVPDQRTQLNSPQKVSELLVTAYPRANYFALAEAMSDNPVENTNNNLVNSNVNIDSYFWRVVDADDQDSPDYYWGECYSAIAAANQALEACNNAPNPADYSAQKGEALIARAYNHFMLVTLFSKAYDPATAATDPGIPYVTQPETTVQPKYERKTVAYVYEQIEKDLKDGLPLIRDSYKVPAYHFTRKAAHAFATRFYLFKKDAAKVIEHANLAFPTNNFSSNMRDWLTYRNLPVDGMFTIFTKATESANLLLGETVSRLGRNYYVYKYGFSQAQLNKILAPVGVTLSAIPTYSVYSTSYLVPKFEEHFVRVNVNATSGTGYTMVPLLTTEEVLFNKAEALVMQEKYPEALADMNAYLSRRIVNYNPGTHNLTETKIKNFYALQTSDLKQAYLLAVLDLKRAEFVHEGMRWLDILRLKLPVTHITSAGQVLTLAPDDLRRVLQIPAEAVQAGVELNPRP